jgi:autotransporter-associated beta strand protein
MLMKSIGPRLACAIAALFTAPVLAQTSGTWNVTGGGTWNTAANWTGSIPGAGGTATFPATIATVPATISLNIPVTLGAINLAGTSPYTISSSTNAITLVSPRTITVSSGLHNLSAPVSGTAGLTKNGAGTLVVGSASTYTGNTAVNDGVLQVLSASGLGPAGSNNQLGAAFTGQIDLRAGVALQSRNIALATPATVSATEGVLHAGQGPSSSAGNWFLLNATSVGAASGATLTHTGDIIDNNTAGSNGLTKVGAGTVVVKRLGGVTVSSGPSTVQQPLSSLNIAAGTVRVATSGLDDSTSRLNSLTIASGGVLDLQNNALALDYTGSSPINTLRSYLQSGRLTTAFASAQNTRLGYVESSSVAGFAGSFRGQNNLDSTTLLVRRTLPGDANLDGTVSFADLLLLAQNYDGTGRAWGQGDFDYDASTNFSDLLLLAQNYDLTLAGSFAADWSLAQSMVPEPASLTVFASATALLVRRRRR